MTRRLTPPYRDPITYQNLLSQRVIGTVQSDEISYKRKKRDAPNEDLWLTGLPVYLYASRLSRVSTKPRRELGP